jgi:hypothetical protein
VTGRCAFVCLLGDRRSSCDGDVAAVVTVHRLVPVQSMDRVEVCDRHLAAAIAVLEFEADLPLEVQATAHGARLVRGCSIDNFPSFEIRPALVGDDASEMVEVSPVESAAGGGPKPGHERARPVSANTRGSAAVSTVGAVGAAP